MRCPLSKRYQTYTVHGDGGQYIISGDDDDGNDSKI